MQKVLLALGVLGAALVVRDAPACSCSPPSPNMISPEPTTDAPLNTRVRLELPEPMPEGNTVVFRVHGETANVKTTERKMPYGPVNVVELVPTTALAPSTRYEVGYIDPNKHPSTTILGSFKTGTTADTTAPKFTKMGAVSAMKNPANNMGSCSVNGPWVQIEGLEANDGARSASEISYAIWLANAAGVIDETKTPTVIAHNPWSTLQLGPMSACDPHAFPYPKGGGTMTFAIAAVDMAGNQSPSKRATVNLAAAKTTP